MFVFFSSIGLIKLIVKQCVSFTGGSMYLGAIDIFKESEWKILKKIMDHTSFTMAQLIVSLQG